MGKTVHVFICLLACFILGSSSAPVLLSWWDPPKVCPAGTFDFRNICYVYFPSAVSWSTAEFECQKLRPDCHLVSFSDSTEEQMVSAYIRSRSSGSNEVWTGLSALPKNKRVAWEWSDDSPYTPGARLWDNWSPSTPITSSKCVSLHNIQNPSASPRWIQQNCDNAYPYVCKYKA